MNVESRGDYESPHGLTPLVEAQTWFEATSDGEGTIPILGQSYRYTRRLSPTGCEPTTAQAPANALAHRSPMTLVFLIDTSPSMKLSIEKDTLKTDALDSTVEKRRKKIQLVSQFTTNIGEAVDTIAGIGIISFDNSTNSLKELNICSEPLGKESGVGLKTEELSGRAHVERGLKRTRGLFESVESAHETEQRVVVLTDTDPTISPDPTADVISLLKELEGNNTYTTFGVFGDQVATNTVRQLECIRGTELFEIR
jgi:hypothetical protein